MAFQAVPDVAEAVIKYAGHGEEFVNVVHGSKVGGYNLADLVVLAVAVDLAVATNWLPLQNIDYQYVSTTVRGLALENDQETVVTTGTGFGVVAGAALPDSVTLSIKKASGLTGRSARGRLYWIGMNAANLTANELALNPTAVTNFVAAVDSVRAGITATVWTAAIVSRFTNSLPRAFGVFFEWAQTVAVDGDVDSQRGRLR